MREGEFTQGRAAGRGEANPDFALIVLARAAGYGTGLFQAVDQFHRAVMLDEEAGSEFADGGIDIIGKAVEGEHELVLLRLNAVFLSGHVAEVKEAANLSSEFRKVAILTGGEIVLGGHICIVPRYKYRAISGRRFGLQFQTGAIQDVHVAVLKPDQALRAKAGEIARDDLSHGAEPGSEFLVSHG